MPTWNVRLYYFKRSPIETVLIEIKCEWQRLKKSIKNVTKRNNVTTEIKVVI